MFLLVLPQCGQVIVHCAQWMTVLYRMRDMTLLYSPINYTPHLHVKL